MDLGVGRHFDMKLLARLRANEGHQLVGVAEFAHFVRTGWHIASQCHYVAEAVLLVGPQDAPHVLARRTDAGQMRRCFETSSLDLQDRINGALLRAATSAEGHGEIARSQLAEPIACCAQLLCAFRGLGRKKLEAEYTLEVFL